MDLCNEPQLLYKKYKSVKKWSFLLCKKQTFSLFLLAKLNGPQCFMFVAWIDYLAHI